MLSSENHLQSVSLPTQKMQYGTIFRPDIPKTWEEFSYTTLYIASEPADLQIDNIVQNQIVEWRAEIDTRLGQLASLLSHQIPLSALSSSERTSFKHAPLSDICLQRHLLSVLLTR